MNSDVAIRVEGLGKRYNLGQTHDLSRTFRETLMSLPRFLGGKAVRAVKESLAGALGSGGPYDPDTPSGTFWALRDINFEVEQGEVIGIIGRNGAGKSTLLKILSRITEPTTGRAEIHGRVGSLLEVGTGFHPGLTGRENIYLNGAILGMRKVEISKRFDEIVDFAEVEKFLDTPVKRYSSGMRVRLAFAVAAHLNPEILVIDEVLAVGDAQFQKKCLGKMEDVAKGGRTVLFVSHNMAAVQNLCPRSFLLDHGRISGEGSSSVIVRKYFDELPIQTQKVMDLTDARRSGSRKNSIRFSKCSILDSEHQPTHTLRYGESLSLYLEVESDKSYDDISLAVCVSTEDEIRIFSTDSIDSEVHFHAIRGGTIREMVTFEELTLMPGRYIIQRLIIRSGMIELDNLVNVAPFEVIPEAFEGRKPPSFKKGLVSPVSKWVHTTLDSQCDSSETTD